MSFSDSSAAIAAPSSQPPRSAAASSSRAEARVDRQRHASRRPSGVIGPPVSSSSAPSIASNRSAAASVSLRRRLVPAERARVGLAPGVQREHRAGQVDAPDLRQLEVRQRLLFALRPQPDAPPGPGAARAAGALGRPTPC